MALPMLLGVKHQAVTQSAWALRTVDHKIKPHLSRTVGALAYKAWVCNLDSGEVFEPPENY